ENPGQPGFSAFRISTSLFHPHHTHLVYSAAGNVDIPLRRSSHVADHPAAGRNRPRCELLRLRVETDHGVRLHPRLAVPDHAIRRHGRAVRAGIRAPPATATPLSCWYWDRAVPDTRAGSRCTRPGRRL